MSVAEISSNSNLFVFILVYLSWPKHNPNQDCIFQGNFINCCLFCAELDLRRRPCGAHLWEGMRAHLTAPLTGQSVLIFNYCGLFALCTSFSSTCNRSASCTCFVRCFFIWIHFLHDRWNKVKTLWKTYNKRHEKYCVFICPLLKIHDLIWWG